jgi:hypothetical protein
MVSRSDNNEQTNSKGQNKQDKQYKQDVKLGGFPPIMYLGQRNKKINEFAKLNDKDTSIKNISKLNILNIKNILGVN